MAGTLAPVPYQTVFDANGNPVSDAQITTYVAGTSTPAATYTDVNLSVPNENPIIADSAGRFVAFLSNGASYKFAFADASGASIKTVDNISAVPATSINLDVTATAGEPITAGEGVYLSDGSGGKTAGQWYGWDSTNPYSSTLPVIGIATTIIASGASGTVRVGGQPTGLTGLVIGTPYYVGAAGAFTSTPPANCRVVGVADSTSSIILSPVPSQQAQGQIVFPATQNPSTGANVLDDYEEGTWTPVLGGSGGTSGQTYTTQLGRYVKIGRLVMAAGRITLSAKGTITTNVQIQGLPFTVENIALLHYPLVITFFGSLNTNWIGLGGFVRSNATTADVLGSAAAATGLTALTTADITNTTDLIFSVSYFASA